MEGMMGRKNHRRYGLPHSWPNFDGQYGPLGVQGSSVQKPPHPSTIGRRMCSGKPAWHIKAPNSRSPIAMQAREEESVFGGADAGPLHTFRKTVPMLLPSSQGPCMHIPTRCQAKKPSPPMDVHIGQVGSACERYVKLRNQLTTPFMSWTQLHERIRPKAPHDVAFSCCKSPPLPAHSSTTLRSGQARVALQSALSITRQEDR